MAESDFILIRKHRPVQCPVEALLRFGEWGRIGLVHRAPEQFGQFSRFHLDRIHLQAIAPDPPLRGGPGSELPRR
jgi:hypothetical protein